VTLKFGINLASIWLEPYYGWHLQISSVENGVLPISMYSIHLSLNVGARKIRVFRAGNDQNDEIFVIVNFWKINGNFD